MSVVNRYPAFLSKGGASRKDDGGPSAAAHSGDTASVHPLLGSLNSLSHLLHFCPPASQDDPSPAQVTFLNSGLCGRFALGGSQAKTLADYWYLSTQ